MKFNTIIGQAARGKDFFPRPGITKEIWEKLDSGSNLLLVAPRRVGKSSILFHLLDIPIENNIVVYYTSESVNNENEFYKKLFNHIVQELNTIQKYQKKLTALGKSFLKSIKAIGKNGIEFQHDNSISYYDEIMNLIKNLDLGSDKMIVLIDEFAETIENIIRDEKVSSALHYLETNREIRQRPETHNSLQFVYAGSIGLENVAEKINAVSYINDLIPIQVSPLEKDEAVNLVNKIIEGTGAAFEPEAFDYLLEITEWWIPFYFQVILDVVSKGVTEKGVITKKDIENAVKNILKKGIYFKNWFTRLRSAFEGNDFSFIKEVLNNVSEKKTFSSAEIINLAVKHKIEDTYNNLLNTLKHDGYINNEDDPKIYRFNSPLLREWWYRNVAN